MEFIPHFILTGMNGYKEESQRLFFKFLQEKNKEFRECILDQILNNIRYPSKVTFYYLDIFKNVFISIEDNLIQEHILYKLFKRLLVEKPHPWG